jgi:hypothetical protein
MTKTAACQYFLARIYTDAAFREEFLASPLEIGKKYDLDAENIRAICQLPLLNFFAQTLIGKRLHIARELLAPLREVNDKQFEDNFVCYASQNRLSGELRYTEDALQFCRFWLNHFPLTHETKRILRSEIRKKTRFVRKNHIEWHFALQNGGFFAAFFLKIAGKILIDAGFSRQF